MAISDDKRRRRYVPVDTLVAFSPFGSKLYERWGMEGLAAWMLLLAAAKREPVQGTFTYTSEAEAWTKLGATATAFTFEEFLTCCGRSKQTKKTRSGRIVYVEITGWNDWNDGWSREQDAERKSRKRAHSTPDIPPTESGHAADDAGTEVEVEYEVEVEVEGVTPQAAPTAKALVVIDGGSSTQTLLGKFIQDGRAQGIEVPDRVKGHLSKEIKALLDEGHTPEAVWAGLGRMLQRRIVQPSLLGNFLMEAQLPVAVAASSSQRFGRGVTTEEILRMADEADAQRGAA